MSLEAKKLELISWIAQLNDFTTVNDLIEQKNSLKATREASYGYSPVEHVDSYEPKTLDDIKTDDPTVVEKAKSNFKWRNRSNAL